MTFKALQMPSAYPDVLKVSAVDRVQNAVGSHQLDRTLDVDVGDDATLVVLNTAEAGEAAAPPHTPATHTSAYAGVVPPHDVPDDHGAILQIQLEKEQRGSNRSVSIMDGARWCQSVT